MAEPVSRQTIGAFLGALGARAPTPGGGAAACLTGAVAASLAGMVVAYTIGRKDAEAHRDRLEDAARRFEAARVVLLRLADEDAEAYGVLSPLLRLPESDPRRQAELPGALEAAIGAPRAAMAACSNVLRLLEAVEPISNRNLRSDLAIAAVLSAASARASAWNVSINLPLVADAERRDEIESDTVTTLADLAERARRVEDRCRGG
ncbi:MAG: cyclodeaminase/cyclohydrolase family protein [Phycisphaerales bacterium]|nr:cyclodeaminase/cyclohydrolase family protein [Phycisphaerales bacterium]